MSKVVTKEQLLESVRKSELLNFMLAQDVAAELAKRPTANEVAASINELFTSVGDGKSLIASAITDKGILTAEDASFQTMRENILAIETGDGTITMESLVITTPPNKVDYYYNGLWHEYFDPTGMTFVLHVDLIGMKLALPVQPIYEAIDQDRHKMVYTMRPVAPEGMSNWPEVELELSPDRALQEGDAQITAEVRWRGQRVQAAQPINAAYSSPRWYDIEKKNRTWAEFGTEFGTWAGVETA